jgi:hypothetical protein
VAPAIPRPLALFFDEIDALRGQSLISVLRQLRDGFSYKSHAFPASVVLCGLRDVRDYKAASGGDPSRLGTASPFNIAVKSLRIGDFTIDDVAALYKQHTDETRQEFPAEAIERAFGYSQGQPWLVNALAREVINEMRVEPTAAITARHIDAAKERLILARASHLDSLASKLNEPRVRKVIEPLQREGIELKVWRKGRPDPLEDGLRQIDEYLARLDLSTGTLIIFDRRPEAAPIHVPTQLSQERTPPAARSPSCA